MNGEHGTDSCGKTCWSVDGLQNLIGKGCWAIGWKHWVTRGNRACGPSSSSSRTRKGGDGYRRTATTIGSFFQQRYYLGGGFRSILPRGRRGFSAFFMPFGENL